MSETAAGWTDPRRLAEWLGHGVDAKLMARVARAPRLARHCARLIDERLGQMGATDVQQVALGLDGLGLMGLGHQAGAAWHAQTILQVIDGNAVRKLIGAIGPGLRSFAIAHAALSPTPAQPADIADLPAAIAADGLRCLIAWCDAQPRSIGQRLVLRLGAYANPDERHRAAGPVIIEALLRRAMEVA